MVSMANKTAYCIALSDEEGPSINELYYDLRDKRDNLFWKLEGIKHLWNETETKITFSEMMEHYNRIVEENNLHLEGMNCKQTKKTYSMLTWQPGVGGK